MPLTACFLINAFWVVALTGQVSAAQPETPLERTFHETIQPFVTKYCTGCHSGERPKGNLDLKRFTSVDQVVRRFSVWNRVVDRLSAQEMPPDDAKAQPNSHERRAVIDWIQALRQHEWQNDAGDPGSVLARRLSNAEFDNTIRDLTGIDMRPTKEFPIDPANEAGFDNSGESLVMSPTILKKYLSAARWISDHIVFAADGLVFAPDPVVSDTDRDQYCVRRIVDFYERHRVDLADYFMAAWTVSRNATDDAAAALTAIARDRRLSPKYLDMVWSILTDSEPSAGPISELHDSWNRMRNVATENAARIDAEALRDQVVRLRAEFEPKVDKLHVRGISDGSQPLVLWRNRQLAERRMSYSGDESGNLRAELDRFCRVFPDRFYVAARGAYFDPKLGAEQRLLTAGFHLMQGYFRDDAPLYHMVLDSAEQRELDDLWRQLNFVTGVPARQYKDFIFFERAEPPRFMSEAGFDFARSEDKDSTSAQKIEQLAAAYLAKARTMGASDTAIEAITTYFANISGDIRWVEQARITAEPIQLESMVRFAERAYRRPLQPSERDEVVAFYHRLRDRDGLGHEDAVRDTVASILISPHFCFRIERSEAGKSARPISEYELANRLSYFLWASMPDQELVERAAAGELRDPATLVAQSKRMVRDARVRGLAQEFAGNWLDFRRFEEHNSVDRDRFAGFTNELRQAMFEEPIRFFADVASNNRSVLDFIYADHTFVNPILAKHYGMPVPESDGDPWVRVDDAQRYGRGGLLPMAVFLTKNSPGLRTSPVKRGYWVVRRLLDETIPAPPPGVPELPKDEATPGELTLPQLLARHRENASCAACHQRFDAIGLVFEGYGPIGERRERDLAGRPVDPRATFPDGSDGAGLVGLRDYFARQRQTEFVDNLCRKLLAYGLGRTLLLSDSSTIENMRQKLADDDYRFDSLIESIVTSPQFLNRRGRDDARE